MYNYVYMVHIWYIYIIWYVYVYVNMSMNTNELQMIYIYMYIYIYCMLYVVYSFYILLYQTGISIVDFAYEMFLSSQLVAQNPPVFRPGGNGGDGTQRFRAQPRWKPWMNFAVDVWLVSQPETKRNTDDTDDVTYFLHIFMKFIYFCILYLIFGISSLILVPFFFGGGVQRRAGRTEHLLSGIITWRKWYGCIGSGGPLTNKLGG